MLEQREVLVSGLRWVEMEVGLHCWGWGGGLALALAQLP